MCSPRVVRSRCFYCRKSTREPPGFQPTVTKIDPWMALRNALGVGLPLAAGAAPGDAGGALIVSIGALNVSFSDGSDL